MVDSILLYCELFQVVLVIGYNFTKKKSGWKISLIEQIQLNNGRKNEGIIVW